MIKFFFIFEITLCVMSGTLYCQNAADDSVASSIGLKFKPAVLLPEFHPTIELNFERDSSDEIHHFHWLKPAPIDNPFLLDMRSSSYYVPRDVRDELNLIMNRPRETAFMPVLGVAYLAYQLAQKYLFIRSKTAITSRDLLAAEPNIDILRTLWEKSPQSATEIYENLPGLNPTIPLLENEINRLQDSKLIRSRQTESETLYFPALSKNALKAMVVEALLDSTLDTAQLQMLKNLLPALNK